MHSAAHAWSNYKKYAWGADNLLPISKGSSNGFLSKGGGVSYHLCPRCVGVVLRTQHTTELRVASPFTKIMLLLLLCWYVALDLAPRRSLLPT